MAVETVWLTLPQKFIIWTFTEKGCYILVWRILKDVVGPKSSPGSPDFYPCDHSLGQGERTKDCRDVLEVLHGMFPPWSQPVLSKQVVNLTSVERGWDWNPLLWWRSIETLLLIPASLKFFIRDTELWLIRDNGVKWLKRLTGPNGQPQYVLIILGPKDTLDLRAPISKKLFQRGV